MRRAIFEHYGRTFLQVVYACSSPLFVALLQLIPKLFVLLLILLVVISVLSSYGILRSLRSLLNWPRPFRNYSTRWSSVSPGYSYLRRGEAPSLLAPHIDRMLTT